MFATEVLYSVEMGLFLLAACVLIGPLIAKRAGVPGLLGLIAVGTILGPSVLEREVPAAGGVHRRQADTIRVGWGSTSAMVDEFLRSVTETDSFRST